MIKALRYSLMSLLVLVCGSAFAQEVKFDWSGEKTTQTPTEDNVFTDEAGLVTLTFSKGAGSNIPAINKEGAIRMYKKTNLNIKAKDGYNIVSVAFTPTGSSYSASNLTYEGTAISDEWTLSSPVNEALLTASANARFKTIIVTVAASGEVVIAKPSISGEEYFLETTEVTLEAAEGDIYYTIDGTEPTSASTKYEAPFTLDVSATVKAVAVKDGKESAVVEKAFEKVVLTDIVIGNVMFMEEPVKWQRVYLLNGQVIYVKGSQVYIRESSNGITAAIFYNVGLPSDIKRGDIINGSLIVDYTLYNEMPEFISNPLTTISDVTIEGNEDIVPIPNVTIEDIEDGSYKCNDVLMQGQIVTGEDGKYYLQEEGGKTILFYGNDEAVSGYANDGKTYFVESIYYGIYKGTHELLPIAVTENDPTAISDVKAETNADAVIYNIAGQRMSKLAKGINIVNGKKVIK